MNAKNTCPLCGSKRDGRNLNTPCQNPHCQLTHAEATDRLRRTMERFTTAAPVVEERPMADYRLPDGTIVKVDDTAAKGALVIGFTLKGGRVVDAVRVRVRV